MIKFSERGHETIFQTKDILNNPTKDVALPALGILAFPEGTTGNVEIVTESHNVRILSVEIIEKLIPRVLQINSAGTTVAGADIYVGL